MELRHLEVFVAVARERNVTRAASRINLTPSPVSRTIRELEREIGTQLFIRKYHDLVMTPAAERLLPRAIEMLRIAGEIRGDEPAPLRLGSTPWAPQLFARRLSAAAAERGQLSDLDEAMSSDLIGRLQFGELDLALVYLPIGVPGIEHRVVARYRHYLAGYPLASVDLRSRKVLILPKVMNAGVTTRIRRQLTQAGHSDIEEIEFSELVTVQSRIRRTGELLVLLRASDTPTGALLDFDQLEFTELDQLGEPMELAVAWRTTDLSKIEVLRSLVDELVPPGTQPEIS